MWRYESTKNIGDAALKLLQVDIQTSVGLTRKDIIVAGSTEGCLRYVLVGFLRIFGFIDVQDCTMKI